MLDSLTVYKSSSPDETVSLRYRPPPQAANKDVGLPFNFTAAYLSSVGFPIDGDFDEVTHQNVNMFVFVTAADANYFHVDMDAIATVQEFFPNYTIYFYDLSDGELTEPAKKVVTCVRR